MAAAIRAARDSVMQPETMHVLARLPEEHGDELGRAERDRHLGEERRGVDGREEQERAEGEQQGDRDREPHV